VLPTQWIGNVVNVNMAVRVCTALARWSGSIAVGRFLQSRIKGLTARRHVKVSERSSRNDNRYTSSSSSSSLIVVLLFILLSLPPLTCLLLAAPHPNRQAPTHHCCYPQPFLPPGIAIAQDLPANDSFAQSHKGQSHLSRLHTHPLSLILTQPLNRLNRQHEHHRPPYQESLRETHHDCGLCS